MMRTVSHRFVSVVAAALASAAVLLAAKAAVAGVPAFEQVLTGRAKDEYFNLCPDASTVGAACSGKICGQDIAMDPGGNPLVRNVTINGTAYNMHDPTGTTDVAVAALFNTVCGTGNGDPMAVAAGAIGMQIENMEAFSRAAAFHRMGWQPEGLVPGSMISVGGIYERGTGTNGGILPVSYSKNLSASSFINVPAAFSYAHRENAGQYGISVSPAYGFDIRQRRFLPTSLVFARVGIDD